MMLGFYDFLMTTKINLLSIFAITTILLTSTIVPNFVAYADDDHEKKNKVKITELQKKMSERSKDSNKDQSRM